MLTEAQRRRVYAIIVINQCLGILSYALVQNGFYLNYFNKLNLPSSQIAFLLSLQPLVTTLLLLPIAFHSDRFGKKCMALLGQGAIVLSLLFMMAAGWALPFPAFWTVVIALTGYGVGQALQNASWIALLNPIVPPNVRGRFFGWMRFTFMSVGVLFTLLISRALRICETMTMFQFLLTVVLAASILRIYSYARIPELEDPNGETGHTQSFLRAMASLRHVSGYVHFNGYVLLLMLFTAAVPIIFGLMQKDVFEFSPAVITRMGNLFLVGNALGCVLGGRVVDRRGTRFVMRLSQALYAGVMLLMVSRQAMPWSLLSHVGICALAYGLVTAMCGLAISSQTLALIPSRNKSLSTAVLLTVFNGGMALSGIFVSCALDWRLFPEQWSLFGSLFTHYDTLLLGFALLAVLIPPPGSARE